MGNNSSTQTSPKVSHSTLSPNEFTTASINSTTTNFHDQHAFTGTKTQIGIENNRFSLPQNALDIQMQLRIQQMHNEANYEDDGFVAFEPARKAQSRTKITGANTKALVYNRLFESRDGIHLEADMQKDQYFHNRPDTAGKDSSDFQSTRKIQPQQEKISSKDKLSKHYASVRNQIAKQLQTDKEELQYIQKRLTEVRTAKDLSDTHEKFIAVEKRISANQEQLTESKQTSDPTATFAADARNLLPNRRKDKDKPKRSQSFDNSIRGMAKISKKVKNNTCGNYGKKLNHLSNYRRKASIHVQLMEASLGKMGKSDSLRLEYNRVKAQMDDDLAQCASALDAERSDLARKKSIQVPEAKAPSNGRTQASLQVSEPSKGDTPESAISISDDEQFQSADEMECVNAEQRVDKDHDVDVEEEVPQSLISLGSLESPGDEARAAFD